MTVADEEKRPVRVHNIKVEKEQVLRLQRYSSHSKIVRVVAWIQRYVQNSRHTSQKREEYLTMDELAQAQTCLIVQVQRDTFQRELQCVRRSTRIENNSRLRDLYTYLDQDGVLRVGGRLSQADMCYTAKHPITLHSSHHFTELLIDATH